MKMMKPKENIIKSLWISPYWKKLPGRTQK